ncbi:MAG: SMP-30/gluconolactonase/LRE family protein [Oricola sp.]|jgi:arylesterase / paraoxonase|nr:SMP-30/gluconolactonase/LRE family protein [Oricola sp.]
MRFLLFLLAVFAGLGAAAGLRLMAFNQFDEIEPVALAGCEPVRGIAGPEDIEIDRRRARAFISSLDRRAEGARGAIHVFDLNDPLADTGWRDRTGGVPADFRPMGVSYYDDGEVSRLFVVNEAGPSVEIYDVAGNGDLTHLKSVSEARVLSPNSVAAAGPDAFYVSNDLRPGRNSPLAPLHFLMSAELGEIFYVEGGRWSLAADKLRFANGLALSADGRTLYAAETAGKALKVFDRDAATGALAPAGDIPLDAAPDNINIDGEGDLWIAALPKPLLLPRLKGDAEATAPSEVLRLTPGGAPATVFRDDGAQQSAATVAARLGDTLLIGALYEQKFLYCDLPAKPE